MTRTCSWARVLSFGDDKGYYSSPERLPLDTISPGSGWLAGLALALALALQCGAVYHCCPCPRGHGR